jgi:hypothetical protein
MQDLFGPRMEGIHGAEKKYKSSCWHLLPAGAFCLGESILIDKDSS